MREENRAGATLFHQGAHTTIYGPAPGLSDGDVEALVATVRSLLPARCLVLAGSVQHPALYTRLASLGVPLALDFCHPCLDECMRLGDVLIAKPNRRELDILYGIADPVQGAGRLHGQRARWAVVTDGAGPAIFQSGDVVRRALPLSVSPVHPVGCGDSLLAGLLHALPRGPEAAVAFAMACGAHNAARPEVAHLDRAACEALARQVVVEPLDDACA